MELCPKDRRSTTLSFLLFLFVAIRVQEEKNVYLGNNVYLCSAKRKNTMPQICSFFGIIITMYLPDHNPPHFHVKHDEFRATIDIDSGEINGNISRRDIQLIYRWLDMHKEELMENWNRLQEGKPIVKIEPLR